MSLRNPILPWERAASQENAKDERNRIPWIALVAFSASELQVDAPTKEALLKVVPAAKENENLGFDLPVSSVKSFEATNVSNNLPTPDEREKKEATSVICIRRDLFATLFARDNSGYVESFKYLSHVRKVATAGMVSAVNGDTGLYSMVVSPRAAPQNIDVPTPIVVHLVSLEKIERTPVGSMKDWTLLTSLHSWTYTALPPNSFDVRKALQDLGNKLTVLRTVKGPEIPKGGEGGISVEKLVAKRQQDGYTIVRHRTVTGEETAAMYRGPLVPRTVPHPYLFRGKGIQSNFGTDLQILDPQLSLMDISYASAWQLGKTLAMGDQAFTACLARLRGAMHIRASEIAKVKVHRDLGSYMSRSDVLANIGSMVAGLNEINKDLYTTQATAVTTNRWKPHQQVESVDISLSSPHIHHQMYDNAATVALKMASATDGTLYNYHKVPENTDYASVLNWVLDKLHLATIPAHYLMPDASYLPEDTLRFFHIDANWTDALVDGALSLANHWADTPELDHVRSAIKKAMNESLSKPLDKLGYRQQIPTYGFLLRSKIVTQFPDLMVSATFSKVNAAEDVKPKAPILIQRHLETDVLLALFDRSPPDLTSLTFKVPAHQQSFMVGSDLTDQELTVNFKGIYTDRPSSSERIPTVDTKKFERGKPGLFNWDTRMLNVETYAKMTWETLKVKLPDKFTEVCPTSAMLALQLNEPIYTLEIKVDPVQVLDEYSFELDEEEPFQFSIPEFPVTKTAATLPSPPPEMSFSRIKLDRRTPTLPRRVLPDITPSPLDNLISNSLRPPNLDIDADRPRFTFNIYPIDLATSEPKKIIPTNRQFPPDLIFSITMPGSKNYNFVLKKITIRILSGDLNYRPPNPTGRQKPMLSDRYEPAMPTMLSNLRFNVVKYWEKDVQGTWLVLEVVPRNSNGVQLSRVEEASFLLGRAEILKWKNQERTYISCKPLYKGQEHVNPPWDDGDVFYLDKETVVVDEETGVERSQEGNQEADDWEVI